MKLRETLLQWLAFASSITSVLALWQSAALITNTQSPIVVVLSESMEPAMQRGDLLFVTNRRTHTYTTGDVVIYNLPHMSTPIVHRVLETRAPLNRTKDDKGTQLLLTKGDNNLVDDRGLYEGPDYIDDSHVIGVVQGILPFVGYVTILFNENPWFKYSVFGGLGLLSMARG